MGGRRRGRRRSAGRLAGPAPAARAACSASAPRVSRTASCCWWSARVEGGDARSSCNRCTAPHRRAAWAGSAVTAATPARHSAAVKLFPRSWASRSPCRNSGAARPRRPGRHWRSARARSGPRRCGGPARLLGGASCSANRRAAGRLALQQRDDAKVAEGRHHPAYAPEAAPWGQLSSSSGRACAVSPRCSSRSSP